MHNPLAFPLITIISFNCQIVMSGRSVRVATQTGAVNVATALPNPGPHRHLLPAVELGLCGGQGGADRLSAALLITARFLLAGGPNFIVPAAPPGGRAISWRGLVLLGVLGLASNPPFLWVNQLHLHTTARV